MSMNGVNLIGRLVRDPEMRKTDDGLKICDLRIAIDDAFSKDGRADFINVTVFGNQAEVCDRYLRKGFMAGVSGRIRSDAYMDSEGVKRYPVKIVADRVSILQWPERSEKAKNEQNRDDALNAVESSETSETVEKSAGPESREVAEKTDTYEHKEDSERKAVDTSKADIPKKKPAQERAEAR
jgi:single-strand DNA-binding protein